MKVSNSIQNIILLLLFVIGMFVLYRYVKTVDIETKMLQNHVIELTEKVQTLSSKNKSVRHLPTQPNHSPQKKGFSLPPPIVEEITRDEDDDNVSIKSVDITNMLRRVMGSDNSAEEEDQLFNTIIQDVEDDMCSHETCMKIEEIVEIDEIVEIVEIDEIDEILDNDEGDDDISFTQAVPSNDRKSVLMKKTNEELKSMLKELSLPTKGSKNELVERIMGHNNNE